MKNTIHQLIILFLIFLSQITGYAQLNTNTSFTKPHEQNSNHLYLNTLPFPRTTLGLLTLLPVTDESAFPQSISQTSSQFIAYQTLLFFAYSIHQAVNILTATHIHDNFLHELNHAYNLFVKRYHHFECLSETPATIDQNTEYHFNNITQALLNQNTPAFVNAASDALTYALITLTNDKAFTHQYIAKFFNTYNLTDINLNIENLITPPSKPSEALLNLAYDIYSNYQLQTPQDLDDQILSFLKNPRIQKRLGQSYIACFRSALGLTGMGIDLFTHFIDHNEPINMDAFDIYSNQLPLVSEVYTLSRYLNWSMLHYNLDQEQKIHLQAQNASNQLTQSFLTPETILASKLKIAIAETYPGNSYFYYLPRTSLFAKDSEIRLTSALCESVKQYLSYLDDPALESTALTIGQAGKMLKNINLTYGWLFAIYGYINKYYEVNQQLSFIEKTNLIIQNPHFTPEIQAIAHNIQDQLNAQNPEASLNLQGVKLVKTLLTTTLFVLNLHHHYLPNTLQPFITGFKSLLTIIILSMGADIYLEHLSTDYDSYEIQLKKKENIQHWIQVLQNNNQQLISTDKKEILNNDLEIYTPHIQSGYKTYEAIETLLALDPHFAMRALIKLLEHESSEAIKFLNIIGIPEQYIQLLTDTPEINTPEINTPEINTPEINQLKLKLITQLLNIKY